MALPSIPAKFVPLSDSGQERFKRAVLEAKYGNGSRQVVGDGINNRRAAGGWRFACTPADAAELILFFDNNGITGFRFTPPADGVSKKYQCLDYGPMWMTADRTDVEAQFTQIFDPE